MGKAKRIKPERLAEKLLKIRESLGLSQSEMVERLGYADSFSRNYISEYESGKREPSLPLLLAYARLAKISTDFLIDDELDLPNTLKSQR
jgi:transcriptional regulator with XRE-family HTH domain